MINLIKDELEKEIKELQSIKKNIKINFVDDILIEDLKNMNFALNTDKSSYIYIIKSKKTLNKEAIKNGIDKAKNENYAMCRFNENNFSENKENCLYVGSSHNLKKRIEEHLGVGGSSKTYAMYLSKWWKYGLITLTYYKVEEDKCLQLFEDILWNYYKPILGRQGKK